MTLPTSTQESSEQLYQSELGQSLVLIALLFAILLLFVGLAVDVGFGFARSSQFSRAVDSAAMAGVVDLVPSATTTTEADIRASQFLGANGWPTPTLTSLASARSLTAAGIPQYTITATWPVETYFLRLVGINGFPITHSATAAYFTNSEMLTPTAWDSGRMRLAAQFISGDEGCAAQGDPVIPRSSTFGTPNEDRPAFDQRYTYRISVPDEYPLFVGNSNLRVELFDPDSYNVNLGQTAVFTHSARIGGYTDTGSCLSQGIGDQCLIITGEKPDAAFQNPYWLWRVDENWDASCNFASGQPKGSAVTRYELYYADANGDRQAIARYTVENEADHLKTDLKWVSPGSPGSLVDTDDGNSFQFDFSGIPTNPDGSVSIFLDVTSEGGTAVNVWDLWAGPTADYYTGQGLAALASDVNQRNLQLANNPYGYSTLGVRIYALGRIPLSNFTGDDSVSQSATLPLVPLDIDLASQTVYGTSFDFDPRDNFPNYPQILPPPTVNLRVNTVPAEANDTYLNVVDIGSVNNQCNPDEVLHNLSTSCNSGTNCDNEWMAPQVQFCIPDTTWFGGGILELTYEPHRDMHVWQFAISAGDAFLTR
jgi:hypothetical protein